MEILLICIVGIAAVGAWLVWNRPGVQSRILKLQGIEVITDLDAILTRTIAFQLNGKMYKVPPLTVERFTMAVNGLAMIDQLRLRDSEEKKISEKELLDAYEVVFSSVCPSIKRRDIEAMSQQQVAALFNTILAQIMGQKRFDSEKKSTPKPMKGRSQKEAG
jgi:hypothetical protein